MVKGKDNSLLVDFEFVVDLDIAMFNFIKDKYKNSKYVDKSIINLSTRKDIIGKMICRKHTNPLEILMPNVNSTDLYYELLDDENNFSELLKYAIAYDTFPLMITFLKEASSVSIDIICRNELEKNFIKSLNPMINTIVYTNLREIPMEMYSIICIKYFHSLVKYSNISGKHIFIPRAKFNMEEDKDCVNLNLLNIYGDINEIHLIDLYKDIKYIGNINDDILSTEEA